MIINNLLQLADITIPSLKEEDGQDLAEYALVLVFVAIVAVAGVTALGGSISAVFDQITAGLAG